MKGENQNSCLQEPPSSQKAQICPNGQATPSFNRNKFTSLEREEQYNTLLQWAFAPERRVELQHNEYPKFLEKLDELKWGAIASPHDKFDPEVEPQQQHQPQQHFTLEQKIDRLTLHMEHVEIQNEMLCQGPMNQQQSFYASYQYQYPNNEFWLSPDEFTARFPRTGVSPTFPGGKAMLDHLVLDPKQKGQVKKNENQIAENMRCGVRNELNSNTLFEDKQDSRLMVIGKGEKWNIISTATEEFSPKRGSLAQARHKSGDAIVVRGVHDVATNAARQDKLETKIDSITTLITQLAINQQKSSMARVCGICTSTDHYTDVCPSLLEPRTDDHPKAYAANIYNNRPPYQQQHYDPPSSSTHNPGWRNQAPFQNNNVGHNRPSYVPPPIQQQRQQMINNPAPTEPSLEELVRQMTMQNMQFQQETKASIQRQESSIQNLTTQMRHMATSLNTLQSQNSDKLPSQTVLKTLYPNSLENPFLVLWISSQHERSHGNSSF
ncbi:hypothetical protein Lal_00035396 [Lupinus albus]|nr:hypothetical protein Lal_00035396 [Lupinus albus]